MVIDMKCAYPLMFVLLTTTSSLHAANIEPPSRDSATAMATITHLDAMPGVQASETASEGLDFLKKVQSFQLSSAITGPFDHFAVDLINSRLFATAESYRAVLVFDINSGKVIHEIKGLAKPHAILYREDLNRLYITDGEDGSLRILDGKTYELRRRISLEKDADSIGYDVSRKLLYVVSGGKDAGQTFSLLSVIDTAAEKKIMDIKIDGVTLEAMALDLYRPKLYLNNPSRNEIEVVDRWKNKVIGTWAVTMGKRNVVMALDEPHQRLFTACRSGQVVIFDSNTGRELQSLPISTGVDDLTYDAASKRIYAAGSGFVDVIEQVDADHYKVLGKVETGPLARTARLVPQLNRYFVAIPQSGSSSASIAVFEPANVPASKPDQPSDALSVSAPFAERLVLSMLSDRPDLRKMGLHAVPPGQTESVIVANGNGTRIGVKTTDGDFEAVKDGKTYCSKKENGSFYNMKLPLLDALGRRIGILVMEIPFTSASDDAEAILKAETIRAEVARRIPELKSLFSE